ncbi:MAG: hypothetical protein J6K41_00820 [Paraprevotella sp.]|nr:hypothetical protein [Paraprevotella sp.]
MYKPFVTWSILFTILHNLFFKLGWYKDSYSIEQLLGHIVKVFAFKDVDENLIGPIWFLKSLFFGSVITYLICLIPKRGMQILAVSTLYIASWCIGRHYMPYLINREAGIVIAIYLGYLLKKREPVCDSLCFILLTFALAIAALYVEIDVVGCVWGPFSAFPVFTILGTVFIFNIAVFIKNKSDMAFKCLSYIGKQSIHILILHFTAFHLLSSLLVSYGIGDTSSLTSQTVLSDINHNL